MKASGVRLLDCDHREMGELFHELNRSLSAGESMQQIRRLLGSIRQITLTHFALEESMMQATDYPDMVLHRLEHQWLAEQNAALEVRARRSGIVVGDPLLNFMAHSHVSHMHHHDNNYGSWLENTALASLSGSNSGPDSPSPIS
jgi:hemerythrin-like metal-binding protein